MIVQVRFMTVSGHHRLASNRRQIHREHDARLRKLIDTDDSARRPMRAHFFNVGPVHLVEIRHAVKKDVHVQDVIEIRANRFEHDLERIENLLGLEICVRSSELARRWIEARRPADRDEFTDHRNVAIWTDGSGRIRRN